MNKGKITEFIVKLSGAIDECFKNEESNNFISIEEVADQDTGDELFLAMAMLVPMGLYKNLTGEDIDMVEFLEKLTRLTVDISKENAVEQYKASLEQQTKDVSQPAE